MPATLQATILEWAAFPFSRGSSQPRNGSGVSRTTGRFFTNQAVTRLVIRRLCDPGQGTKWSLPSVYAFVKWRDGMLKSRDVTLPKKVRLIKAMVFPVVMYGCESWTIKKAEHRRIDAFKLQCWRSLLRVPWTARRFKQSILKEISPGCSLKGLLLKLKLQYFGHLMWKSWLIWKDPDAGRDWGQEEKGTTEDEMVGWHHWLNGHEFGWTLGVGDGQGGLACSSPWDRKELDTTEQLNWTENGGTVCAKDWIIWCVSMPGKVLGTWQDPIFTWKINKCQLQTWINWESGKRSSAEFNRYFWYGSRLKNGYAQLVIFIPCNSKVR